MAEAITHERRCSNVQCRVETYVGSPVIPLNACPVCLQPGSPTVAAIRAEAAGGSTP